MKPGVVFDVLCTHPEQQHPIAHTDTDTDIDWSIQ
jgi:hypothetical protein